MISKFDEIDLTASGLLPQLVNDYIQGKGETRQFYKYLPHIDAFKQIIEDKAKDDIDRALLVKVLKNQYAGITSGQAVEKNIAALSLNNTYTVTAAHQPCLFMGPLYNVVKICAAINLSLQLKQRYPENNFVPVFWMGSEDHDMDELNHAYVKGKKLQWEGGSGPVGRLSSELIKPLLPALKDLTGDTAAVSALEEAVFNYASVGKVTQAFLNTLFKEHGLVVIDQDDALLKARFASVIEDEIFNKRAFTVLQESVKQLETLYKVQASPREINFFYLGEGFRERIVTGDEDSYAVNNRAEVFSAGEMKAAIKSAPESFSPNVIMRPLFQEMVLPNLAFIGGGGEISYWLELKPLFDYYKVNFPALVLRNSVAILPNAIKTKIEKAGLSVADVFRDPEKVLSEKVKEQADGQLSLSAYRAELEKIFEGIAQKAGAVDTTLTQSAAGEKQKALNALDNLEAKMLKAEKRKQETLSNQLWAIHEAIFPQEKLQERFESFIPYCADGFMDEMIRNLNPLEFKFRLFVEQ